jgi:hypothetical protein
MGSDAVVLDERRGMTAQKATEIRRLRSEVEAQRAGFTHEPARPLIGDCADRFPSEATGDEGAWSRIWRRASPGLKIRATRAGAIIG